MTHDGTNFLLSLAYALGQACAGDGDGGGGAALVLGTDLYVHEAVEGPLGPRAAGYGVLRIYGGEAREEQRAVATASIQVAGCAPAAKAALALAWRLYNALLDADGLPTSPWTFAAKKFSGGTVVADGSGTWTVGVLVLRQPPVVIGGDENRVQAVFNVDVKFNGS